MSEPKESFASEVDTQRRQETYDLMINRLKSEGIDVEKYRPYYDVMKRNDAPVVNAINLFFPDVDIESVHSRISSWQRVVDVYRNINWDDQNEETGINILKRMKPLIEQYMVLLTEYQRSAETSRGVIPNPPEELLSVKRQILDLAIEHGRLPAYQVYRACAYLDTNNDKR